MGKTRNAMFDFIRKQTLWDAFDRGWAKDLSGKAPFHLKTIQDCAVYSFLYDAKGLDIAEIGGGDSRVLRAIAKKNKCVNVEKFEGVGNGPKNEIKISKVHNIDAYLGEQDPRLHDNSFDIVFSVSVVEHLLDSKLTEFFEDGVRILKRGGLWLHAVDMYLEETPADYIRTRFDTYRGWASMNDYMIPVGKIFTGDPVFTPDMATNPDNVMYEWGKISPKLIELRKKAQSVSVLVASRKV